MHAALRITALAAALTSLTAHSQVYPGLGALYVPTDPRSVALGESMVGARANQAALMFNPAGLTGVEGISTNYGFRQNQFAGHADGAGMLSVSASVSSSIGLLGILYNRTSLGKIPITDEVHPDGTGQYLDTHEEFFGIGVAHNFGENWSVGVSFKTVTTSGWMPETFTVTSRPYLLDFGLLFTLPDIFPGTGHRDRLTLGLSAQNMGTDYRIKANFSPIIGSYYEREYVVPVPRYVRLGFSYEIWQLAQGNARLSPVGLLVTAEYRALTNPSAVGYDPFARDFWGMGLELSVYEVVKVRLGGYAQPYTNLYGDKGTLKARYGAGLALPLTLIGLPIPITVGGDYANVPVNESYTGNTSSLNAYSFTLQLDSTVF